MIILILVLCMTVIFHDLLFRRVPNWLLIATVLVHIGWLVMVGHGWKGINVWQSLTGGVVGIALFLPFYAWRVMGAGDVKFFTLLGAMMGAYALFPIWLIASVFAGMHAMLWYLATKQILPIPPMWHHFKDRIVMNDLYQQMVKKRKGRQGIPYAAYLAMAALMIVNH